MEEKVILIFDGEEEECTVRIDGNEEYLCETEDGRFVKFAKDSDFAEEVKKYNLVNAPKVD